MNDSQGAPAGSSRPRGKWRRYPVAALLLLALLGTGTGTAWAHALLTRSDPAPDIVLRAPPSFIHLWFTEDLNGAASQIVVWDRDRHVMNIGHASIVPGQPRQLEVRLKPLHPGAYLVLWTSVSAEDGHILRGSYLFFVKERGPGPSLTGVATGTPGQSFPDLPGFVALAAHWLELLAATVWFGAVVFSALVFTPVAAGLDITVIDAERRRLRSVLRFTLALLVVSSAVVLLEQAYVLAGNDWGRTFSAATRSEIFAGEYGQLWIAREAVALAALLGVPLITAAQAAPSRVRSLAAAVPQPAPPRGLQLSVALGLLYLALFAASGHAAAADIAPVLGSRIVSGAVFADLLHFLGDGLWVGGQIYIVLVLIPILRLRRSLGPNTHAFLDALNRFSPIAYGSIALFVISGLFAAKVHIASWYAFFHSVYGWTLVAKVGLIGLMMLVSAFTVYIVRPHIHETLRGFAPEDAENTMIWLRRLLNWLHVNPMLGAGVLLATSVMFSYPVPPGLSPAGPSSYPIRLGSLSGTIALKPDRSGPNQIIVTLHDAHGRPVSQATVVVLTTMLDMEMGTGKAALSQSTPGTYIGSTDLGMGGHWSLRILTYSPAGLFQTTVRVIIGT